MILALVITPTVFAYYICFRGTFLGNFLLPGIISYIITFVKLFELDMNSTFNKSSYQIQNFMLTSSYLAVFLMSYLILICYFGMNRNGEAYIELENTVDIVQDFYDLLLH